MIRTLSFFSLTDWTLPPLNVGPKHRDRPGDVLLLSLLPPGGVGGSFFFLFFFFFPSPNPYHDMTMIKITDRLERDGAPPLLFLSSFPVQNDLYIGGLPPPPPPPPSFLLAFATPGGRLVFRTTGGFTAPFSLHGRRLDWEKWTIFHFLSSFSAVGIFPAPAAEHI